MTSVDPGILIANARCTFPIADTLSPIPPIGRWRSKYTAVSVIHPSVSTDLTIPMLPPQSTYVMEHRGWGALRLRLADARTVSVDTGVGDGVMYSHVLDGKP